MFKKISSFFQNNKFILLASLGAIILFFLLRLINILHLPIFTDEAIYIRWSQIAKDDASWRFISLTDGKQPMFVWLAMTILRFVKDPLLGARLVSVGAGFGTLVGLFFLGKTVFNNKWVGFFSSFLYVIFPMGLVYDRMAIYDSLVTTFTVWCLLLIIMLARYVRLDIALIAGLAIGGAVLNKSMGFFNIYFLPFTLLLFDWKSKQVKSRLLKWVGLAVVVTILTYVCYTILRLSPYYYLIDEKNTIFIYPFKEWIHHPFQFFFINLREQWWWFITYLTWPIFFLVFLSFFIQKRLYFLEKVLLFVWFLAPFLVLALFGKTIYPRYILFMMVPLLPLAGYTLVYGQKLIKNRLFYSGLVMLFCLWPLYNDYIIVTNFAHAPIPKSDLIQYMNDWPAGGGVKEAVAFFEEKAKTQKIYVGTQGTFGLMPYSLEIYLVKNPNITIKGFWPTDDLPPQEVIDAAKHMPTYFLFYQPCSSCRATGEGPITWPTVPVLKFQKGENTQLTVVQVKPK